MALLIAPLMELKCQITNNQPAKQPTFNRTAYGIEIAIPEVTVFRVESFNRTAYGIEIKRLFATILIRTTLLIAPLMELKLCLRLI